MISLVNNEYSCLVELLDVLIGMLVRERDATATASFLAAFYSFFELLYPLLRYDFFNNVIIRILFWIAIFRIVLSY